MRDVAAVVVTRNRKQMLLECLAAIRAQDPQPSAIYVIDNASDDGTPEALAGLAAGWPALHPIRLGANSGGAGGFHRGMLEAFTAGHEWLWLMDDDCLPRTDSLQQLLAAIDRLPAGHAPSLACSRVEWTDGTLHPLNLVKVASADKDWLYACAGRGTLAVRGASFVSLLLHRGTIARHGLPVAAYFLWLDDAEWTARVLRRERGILVPGSVVVHRTATLGRTEDAEPGRFRLFVRNSCWMLLGSDCYSFSERMQRALVVLYIIAGWLSRRWWRPMSWITVLAAGARGLVPPRREPPPR